MKYFIFFLLIICFQGFAGTEIQNGGGGLSINGQVATFGTLKIDVQELTIANLSGLLELCFEINRLSLSVEVKGDLISLVVPSSKRKYYKVDQAVLANDDIKKIIKDYKSSIPGTLKDEFVLFGITNTENSITLLLPDFFKLNLQEKEAVLFHESMWLSGKINNIEEMIDIEIKFQNFLEKRTLQSKFDFYFIFGKRNNEDYSGLLNSLLTTELLNFKNKKYRGGEISFKDVFGEDSLAALSHYIYKNLLKENDLNSNELIYTLQQEIQNTSDPFWFTKYAIVNILLSEGYYNGFRDFIIFENGEVNVAIREGKSRDEVEQKIIEILSDSLFLNYSEEKYSGEMLYYDSRDRDFLGQILPGHYYN